jgi:hypothetical protein
MINYILNNFTGMMTFQSITSVQISEVNVTSSSVTPTFYGGICTNQGFVFFTDLATTETTNFNFINLPIPLNEGKILKYTASAVYYFYFYSGSYLFLFNATTQTSTSLLSVASTFIAMDIVGTTLYLADEGFIHRYTIGAGGALTANGLFEYGNIQSLCALDANNVLLGLKGTGYAKYDFATFVLTIPPQNNFSFVELSLNGSYIVGTNNDTLWVEPTSTLFMGNPVITSLGMLNINGSQIIRCLNNSVSGVVTFATGNGIASVTLSTSVVASFLNQSALGNQSLINISYFDVTSDGISYLTGQGILATIYKHHEKLYTYTSTLVTTQKIYRYYQGRLRSVAKFLTSAATATVAILDENGITLDNWNVVAGLTTNSGPSVNTNFYGYNTPYCYFDAPLGLTNQNFQWQITSSANETVNVYLEEVPQ